MVGTEFDPDFNVFLLKKTNKSKKSNYAVLNRFYDNL
jgi:hypothetical protein